MAALQKGALLCRCGAEQLVMVGDRFLTDVVYGNQNGMFTIRPAPLTLKGEPSVVRMVSAPLDTLEPGPSKHGAWCESRLSSA